MSYTFALGLQHTQPFHQVYRYACWTKFKRLSPFPDDMHSLPCHFMLPSHVWCHHYYLHQPYLFSSRYKTITGQVYVTVTI